MLILITCGLTLSAQENKIDSLVKKLSNNEIKPDGNFIGPTFYLGPGPGLELLNIGKPVTKKLLDILYDTTKGVVAHYILTALWKDSIPWVNPIYIEREGITAFTFNVLPFLSEEEKFTQINMN